MDNDEYPVDNERPVISIGAVTPLAATAAVGVSSINFVVGVPTTVTPPVALGVPVNRPSGSSNVILPVFAAKAPVEDTFSVIVSFPAALPGFVDDQPALPVMRETAGTHFFESLSHVVPTSQHPGP